VRRRRRRRLFGLALAADAARAVLVAALVVVALGAVGPVLDVSAAIRLPPVSPVALAPALFWR